MPYNVCVSQLVELSQVNSSQTQKNKTMSTEIRQMIDKVKNFKEFVNENVDNDMYHYVIHTGLGNRLDTMGDLYWVKANKNLLKSKVWSLFVSKHPELKDTEITQISKDTFDNNAVNFEIIG